MIVRPLNAAKPATTSRRSALSHVTVMRGACDWTLSEAWAARYASIVSVSVPGVGVATRAACPPRLAAGCARAAAGAAAALTGGDADSLDHASNPVRSDPTLDRKSTRLNSSQT